MKIKQFEVWIADLNPHFGTESGRRRPVCIVQTNLLNAFHPSSIICPITTNTVAEANLLRIQIRKGQAGMNENSDLMIDQFRAIDNERLIKKVGDLSPSLATKVKENLIIILDLI